MDKRTLTERDICTKFIMPALKRAGWDEMLQIREEVYFTNGRIIVRGKLVSRGKAKKADFVLYYKPNIPIAIIEAKDNNHSVGEPCGMPRRLSRASVVRVFSHFVTSMTAPIASGWSGRRVGLAPAGKRRLCTAHTHDGHRGRATSAGAIGWHSNSRVNRGLSVESVEPYALVLRLILIVDQNRVPPRSIDMLKSARRFGA
jgi:hypothetical protein